VNIEAWELADLLTNDDINVNTATMEDLVRQSAPLLASVIETWTSFKPDIVYLENQPLGMMARNVKTKTLSHIMQALLLAKGFTVKFVSPQRKLKGMVEAGSYGDNKKFAIASCSKLLGECGLHAWKEKFEEKGGKKDDLADAFLQGYYAARNDMKPAKVPKEKKTKKKRDSHQETEQVLQVELE